MKAFYNLVCTLHILFFLYSNTWLWSVVSILWNRTNMYSTQDAAQQGIRERKKGREKKKRSGNFYVTFSGSYNHKCLLLLPRNGYVLLTSFTHHKCMQKTQTLHFLCKTSIVLLFRDIQLIFLAFTNLPVPLPSYAFNRIFRPKHVLQFL